MNKFCPICEELLKVDAIGPHDPILGRCKGCGWTGLITQGLSEPRPPVVSPKLPYVSIDIETTGLNENTCQTLEVGAVFEDWKSPLDELPRFRRVLLYETVTGSPYAMALNANLLKLIANAPKTPAEPVFVAVDQWAEECGVVVEGTRVSGYIHRQTSWWAIPNALLFDTFRLPADLLSLAANPPGLSCFCHPDELPFLFGKWIKTLGLDPMDLQAAGKNFAGFDKLFLNKLPGFSQVIKFRHRVLDPAVLFWQPEDKHLPDSKTCKERSGRDGKVMHTAIEDALDVIWAVRQGTKRLWRN